MAAEEREDELLEAAFAHIQNGNDWEASAAAAAAAATAALNNQNSHDDDNHKKNARHTNNHYWQAAMEFAAAQRILERLGSAKTNQRTLNAPNDNLDNERETENDKTETVPADKTNDHIVENEHKKIMTLYQQQAAEYFYRARNALLQAMTVENQVDELLRQRQRQPQPRQQEQGAAQTTTESMGDCCGCGADRLPEEIAHDRLELFSRLFARDCHKDMIQSAAAAAAAASSHPQDMQEMQSSIEQRLMQLNDSLPVGLKTSEQRMREINRGLNRLGFSLYSDSSEGNGSALLSAPPKSEDEQINEIIAQAKDEVGLNQGTILENINPLSGVEPTATVANDGQVHQNDTAESDPDSTNDDDDDDDEKSDNSSVDADDKPELTHDQIRSIREKAVEAQVHLAHLIALMEIDEGGDAEIEFCPSTGKHALNQARKLLQTAAKEWTSNKKETDQK